MKFVINCKNTLFTTIGKIIFPKYQKKSYLCNVKKEDRDNVTLLFSSISLSILCITLQTSRPKLILI